MNDLQPPDLSKAPSIESVEILSVAGAGGMSVVYKARQTTFSRIVAIKMLHPHLVANTTSLQRFMQEGRVATTLKHPNIARVYSCGSTDGEHPFLVMEYLEGESLKDLIDTQGVLSATEVKRIFDGVLAGLQVAHDAGIIHRDLKPGNVMLVADDTTDAIIPKIVDFGIAKLIAPETNSEMQRLTQTGAVVGSPSYMSPEQCTAMQADARADIYAVGCMMFEALTGRLPFECDNALGVMTMHLTEEPVAPSTVAPRPIPIAFDAIILKCLSKDPAARFQSADELRKALGAVNVEALGAPSSKQVAVPRKTKAKGKSTIGLLAVLASALCIGALGLTALMGHIKAEVDPELKAWDECEELYNKGDVRAAANKMRGHTISVLPRAEQARAARLTYGISQVLQDYAPQPEFQQFLRLFRDQAIDRKAVSDIARLSKIADKDYAVLIDKLDAAIADPNLYDKPYVGSLLAMRVAHSYKGNAANAQNIHKALNIGLDLAKKSNRPDHLLRVLLDSTHFSNTDRPTFLQLHDQIVANDNAYLKQAMAAGTVDSLMGASKLMQQSVSIPETGRRDLATAHKCETLLQDWLKARPSAMPWMRALVMFDRGLLANCEGRFRDSEALMMQAIKEYGQPLPNDDLYAQIAHYAAASEVVLDKRDECLKHYEVAFESFRKHHQTMNLVNTLADFSETAKGWEASGDAARAARARKLLAESNSEIDNVFAKPDSESQKFFFNYQVALITVVNFSSHENKWAAVKILGARLVSLGQRFHKPELEADGLAHLSNAALNDGKLPLAEEYLERCLAIRRKLPQYPATDLLESEGKLISLHYNAKHHEKIEAPAKRLVKTLETTDLPVSQYGASVPIVLALVYAERSRNDEARALVNRFEKLAREKNTGSGFNRNLDKLKTQLSASK